MMNLELRIENGIEALPVRVTTPDGKESKLEIYDKSCALTFFAPGTKLELYEPVELNLASILVVKDDDDRPEPKAQ